MDPADLMTDFGLTVSSLRPHPGGFESDCWVADETWFVKWWKQPGLPNLELLAELQSLGLPVVAPIPSVSGELSATRQGRPYAVFPYIQGRTATDDDWRSTARAIRHVHEKRPELPRATLDEPEIHELGRHLDHPWIAGRRDEVAAAIARLDAAVERARAKEVPEVLIHRDLHGLNLIIDDAGGVAAILDWEVALVGPREHDVWVAAEGPHLQPFLDEYGAHDLDLDHLEYALLARALRDMAARVFTGVDRPGVDTWGFDRIARLDRDLREFRAYC